MHYMTKMKIKKIGVHLMQSHSQIVCCNFYYIVYKFSIACVFYNYNYLYIFQKVNIYFIYVIIKKEKCDGKIFACLV